MEERISALTTLVPSVLSFVVVISSVIRAEMIGALTPLVLSISLLLLCLSCNFVKRGSVRWRRCYRQFSTFSLLCLGNS